MQTERVTFLASPTDKALLASKAAAEGISLGEYIRRKALNDDDEVLTPAQDAELRALTAEVNRIVPEMAAKLDSMSATLRETHEHVDQMLRDMGAR